jgi:hypothetical protein
MLTRVEIPCLAAAGAGSGNAQHASTTSTWRKAMQNRSQAEMSSCQSCMQNLSGKLLMAQHMRCADMQSAFRHTNRQQ